MLLKLLRSRSAVNRKEEERGSDQHPPVLSTAQTVQINKQQEQWHRSCVMGKFFARTSTRAIAAPTGDSAPMVCTNVPKSCEEAGLVACLTTVHTTVGTLDGAPVMER